MALKKRWTALCVALALVTALAPWLPALAQGDDAQQPNDLGYIVKLRGDVPMLLSDDTPGEGLGLGMYLVDDPREVRALTAAGAVEFIEPNYIHYLCHNGLVNDECYVGNGQWNLDFMDIGPLWDLGLTGEDITVAVIDTGLDPHDDLPAARMLEGYNAVDGSANVADVEGHGTFVASVIAAQADNGICVAGVAHQANIVPGMVFEDMELEDGKWGVGATAANITKAIVWATDHGADVINLSLGGHSPNQATQEAVDYAVSKGVILVAAAGNDGNAAMNYPAGYKGVIGVGALGEVEDISAADYELKLGGKGNWAQYSNYNTSVFVSAPGTEMYGAKLRQGSSGAVSTYHRRSGTSFAAPCVAGLAALAKEYDKSINAARFQNLLMLTADDRGDAGWDAKYGYGSANAARMAAALPERSITYDLNGGAWQEEPTSAQTAFRTYQEGPVTLPVPVREGYAFMGWYRSDDFAGAPESVLTLPALEESVTYTARWVDDNTALDAVDYVLDGKRYACFADGADSYRLCLPAGTDLAGGALEVRAKSERTEIYTLRSDADPGLWAVRATPESGHVKTYQVTIDLSHHIPVPTSSRQVTATVAPSSMDGKTPAQTYTADLSKWFSDPGGEPLTYTLDALTVDGVAAEVEDHPTLLLAEGVLSYTPRVTDANKELRLTVTASNPWFTGPGVTLAITVGTVPPDQPPVEVTPPPTATPTATAPATPTPISTPTPTATATAPATPTPISTPTPTPTPTATPTPIATPTPTPISTPTPTATATATPTPTATATPPAIPTATPTATPTPTPPAEPSQTPAPSPSASPSPAPSPAVQPSTSGSGGFRRPGSVKADPPEAPAAPAPGVVTVREEGGAKLELTEPRPLTQGERQAVFQANARGAVTIRSSAGLRVAIPKGVLQTEGQVDGLLTDVSQARAGDVIIRIDDQGQHHVVPMSVVGDSQAAYVAEAPGNYALRRGGTAFADVGGHWAKDAIAFSTARELTRGMSADHFDPDRHATRAMVFTLLARLEGDDLPASQGEWYDSAVTWAMDRGLSDGTRPQGDVKREELVTLLWRWSGQPQAQGSLEGFPDHSDVSPYARQAMVWAVESGIISGRTDASIDPATGATRAETAAILQRFITYQVEQQLGE